MTSSSRRSGGLSRLLRTAVQHVTELAVEPRFAGSVVVLGIDHFVMDVREVATQARDLLRQAVLRPGHEIPITLIPELVTVGDRPRHTTAVRLDRAFRHQYRL